MIYIYIYMYIYLVMYIYVYILVIYIYTYINGNMAHMSNKPVQKNTHLLGHFGANVAGTAPAAFLVFLCPKEWGFYRDIKTTIMGIS